jgi:acyl carrier protein
MRERLRELMARVFDVEPAELPPNPTPDSVEGWSSLKHVELMLAVEEELDVFVDPELAPQLTSLDALAEFAEANVRPPAPA